MTIATQQFTAATSSTTSSSTGTSGFSFDSSSSYQSRSQNALQKRALQLRRWEENEELEKANNRKRSRIRVCFSASTLFLTACAQNDLEEAERLLSSGQLKGGVDVTNCDGLTALHQACIDDNKELVKWLLDHGANINCKDNEGWTPLHASANFGNADIVAQLLAHPNCDVFSLNCDNELALDVAENSECEKKIRQKMTHLLGVPMPADDDDDDEPESFADLRQVEMNSIERDIENWTAKKDLSTFDVNNEFERTRDPTSGATILHVCAAKGYNEQLDRLLGAFEGCIDVDNFRDCDGFSPLHAAAFWKQPETFETLLKFGANPELPTPKTAENSMPSSVLELCKNDPTFVQLVESSKEKIAKESETQRKIHAKRQREGRRSTQGVKKEDLENALKMMNTVSNSTPPEPESATSITSVSPPQENVTEEPELVNKSSGTSTAIVIQRNNGNNEGDVPTTFKIRLPSRSSVQPPEEPESPIPTVTLCRTTETIPSFTQPEASVSLTITSASPSDSQRRRRIKRRATGIEDDSGHALSPDSFPPDMNPFAKKNDENGNSDSTNGNGANKSESNRRKSEPTTPTSVDAAFDVILSSPNQQRSARIIQRPVSAASSSTSLNSYKSYGSEEPESRSYGSTSMQSLDQIDSRDRNTTNGSSRYTTNNSLTDSEIKNINSGVDDIDYKKLCRQLLRENEQFRRRIKELEEAEKKRDQETSREKRSMQRTISEQEEELKTMQELKAENVKLKDDNAALIRVISKLSK